MLSLVIPGLPDTGAFGLGLHDNAMITCVSGKSKFITPDHLAKCSYQAPTFLHACQLLPCCFGDLNIMSCRSPIQYLVCAEVCHRSTKVVSCIFNPDSFSSFSTDSTCAFWRAIMGNAMHAVRTQCEVLDVGKYSNPSFGPFSQIFGSVPGFFLASQAFRM